MSMSEHVQRSGAWGEAGGQFMGAQSRKLGRDGRSMLEDTIRQDVIPRLVAMSWVGQTSNVVDARPVIGAGTCSDLIALCLDPDSRQVAVFVAELHRSGITAASIYEDLLTPVARELGVMWENDTCNLADVTIGLLRLQNAQRVLAAQPLDAEPPPLGAPRALLMAVPGEQHTFGLSIVLDFFVRAGWDARLSPVGTRQDALAAVRRERTELVGLSFACEERLPDATGLIASIRDFSRNPHLIIMVGGPSFMADPGLAARIGADATATDGRAAVMRANELLQAQDGHRTAGPV